MLRRLEVGVAAVALAIAAVAALRASALGFGLGGAALVAGVAAEWFLRRRFHAWGYAERQDDLLVRRGVMFSRLSVIPYGRMQFVDVTAGPLERAFGVATVRLHTAAAATDARIPGLARDEAARLRDLLAERGEAQAAGI
jgi:membrane protein YdbS with pleckstrin-like domain